MISSAPTLPAFERTDSVGNVLRSPQRLLRESLAGIMTALALVPEVISFSFVSGVSPEVSLLSSVALGLVMSLLGGRSAMVTAAAGSVALVIGPSVDAHGVQYVLPTVLLAGAIQIAFGALGLARVMRYVPRSVALGFVNALGILIFMAQVPHVLKTSLAVWFLFLVTLAIVHWGPRLTRNVPAPLVAIAIVTLVAVAADLRVPNVGGGRDMHVGWPLLSLQSAPLDLTTLRLIWPTALSVAFVGLLESLLTAKLVDDLTDSRSNKNRESWALGVANVCAACLGGIGGCAMIGQTVVNVELGGARTRVSTCVTALVLLLLVTGLSRVLAQIPMVTLAAVMMVVALKTVNWNSLKPSSLRRMPLPETAVMLLTVALTVGTGNLAFGVAGGVLLATILFARRVAHVIDARRTLHADGGAVRYDVHGPVFFASSGQLVERFAYAEDPPLVSVDFTHAQIWDASSVAALDRIESRYRQLGTAVTFSGLDARSREFYGRLTGQLD
ncbi:MAG TPA: SulP family inorganic anion transporter [Polyangiaceae bacterium]|jgi:SulP family sulfate permease|nr:SulP family inorganic anion transporter [Polyangiaceae bacterium]